MVKKIIVMAAVGLVSFGGAFVFAWLTSPSAPVQPAVVETPAPAADSSAPETSVPESTATDTGDSGPGSIKRAMTEQQLKTLVQDIQKKIREYDQRLQALGVQEQRLQVTQDVLKQDIESLNNLRTELASTVATIKSEREKLLKSRLEIEQSEKVNLASIAATYDKMDASSAGKILASMCAAASQTQSGQGGAWANGGYDEAVKILHYMTERTKAKLLAELATSEPQLAAVLSQRLRQIAEKQ